jgi:hypothetical protein
VEYSSGSKSIAYGNGSVTTYLTAGSTSASLLGKSNTTAGWTGTIYSNTSTWFSGGNLYASSDESLKNIKSEINVDIEKLLEIRKILFTFKNDENNQVQLGTIAQDVQKLYPEIVDESNDGILSVSYERLNILAMSAIDILNKRIEKLETILGEN